MLVHYLCYITSVLQNEILHMDDWLLSCVPYIWWLEIVLFGHLYLKFILSIIAFQFISLTVLYRTIKLHWFRCDGYIARADEKNRPKRILMTKSGRKRQQEIKTSMKRWGGWGCKDDMCTQLAKICNGLKRMAEQTGQNWGAYRTV